LGHKKGGKKAALKFGIIDQVIDLHPENHGVYKRGKEKAEN